MARRDPTLPDEGQKQTAEFTRLVRQALARLHDIPSLQRHPLARLMPPSSDPRAARPALQSSLLEAIESVRPNNSAPRHLHAWRGYEILRLRFVEGLEVNAVASQLSLSRSEYFHDQQAAIGDAALYLWERWHLAAGSRAHAPLPSGPVAVPDEKVLPPEAGETWPLAALPRLPEPWTSLVGRERELAEVKILLTSSRLVTLTGTGGCGKTRLAIEVARGVVDAYPDGAWFVELAPLADAGQVASLVAGVLGLREVAGQPITATLTGYLRSRTALLVLDNCEHLVESCARLVDILLGGCRHLSVLTTSREVLALPGEVVWRVPSLSYPATSDLQSGDLPSPEILATYGAVRLFVERARAVRPSFAVSPSNARAVAEICQHLDGMPLALELAAARLRTLSVDDLLVRLVDRFRLLTGGSRTALRRQQTLAATVDWSYDLLDEQEASLFNRLSVFSGSWSLEAAEEICTGEPVEEPEVLDLLTRLIEKSLVVVVDSPLGGERYRLHETLRQYGQGKLFHRGEAPPVRTAHAAFFLALAERAEPYLRGPQQEEWLARLEQDWENLQQALQWLVEVSEVGRALRLAGALWGYLGIRSRATEGRALIGAALAKAPAADPSAPDAAALAKCLQGAGALSLYQGDYQTSRTLLEQSITLFRGLGDLRGVAWSLVHLGWSMSDSGDLDGGRSVLEEAVAVAREAGDRLCETWALARLGLGSLWLTEYERAVEQLTEAVVISRSLGDRWGVAWAQHLLAIVYSFTSEPQPGTVERLEHESLAVWRALGSRRDEAYSFVVLGQYYVLKGRLAEADRCVRDALPVFAEMGDTFGMLSILGIDCHLEAGRGQKERAIRLAGAVDSIFEATGMTKVPMVRVKDDRLLRQLRRALGRTAFSAIYQAGQAMTLDQAVEYALQVGQS